MKFLYALGALALGVSAQSTTASASGNSGSDCLADYIVTRCLETETPKAQDCSPNDYNCLCAAYEAIATCYNNCPSDPRASGARQQVNSFCALATTSTRATASATTTTEASSETEEPTSTLERNQRPSNTRSFDSDVPEETGNDASPAMVKSAGLLLGIAGFAAVAL